MFRAVGVPARYVSGYFYAIDGTEGAMPADAEISVQTHAWVEVAIPERRKGHPEKYSHLNDTVNLFATLPSYCPVWHTHPYTYCMTLRCAT